MEKINIIVEIDGKKMESRRIIEGCTEEQIKERVDSLLDGVKISVYIKLGIPNVTLSNGKEHELPNRLR